MKSKKEYKEMITSNGYIMFDVVTEFLRKGMIADYELIAEIYNKGMSQDDYQHLQSALDELEIPNIE